MLTDVASYDDIVTKFETDLRDQVHAYEEEGGSSVSRMWTLLYKLHLLRYAVQQ